MDTLTKMLKRLTVKPKAPQKTKSKTNSKSNHKSPSINKKSDQFTPSK